MKRKKPIMRKPMALLLCLVVAVTFTMPVVAFGEGDTGETRSFDVNLFDYDQQKILNALEEKFPGALPQSIEPVFDVMENRLLMEGAEDPVDLLIEESQSPEHSLMKESEGLEGTVDLLMVEPQGIVDPDYSQMFMFMGGRGKDAAPDDRPWFSKWEKDHYVYQGLMKYDLNSKGRPEYTDGILGIDLFDPNESEDYDAYKNIPFEFNYDSSTEIYSYSSSKNSATFDGSGVSLGESLGGGVSVNGFRPFGSEPESVLDHFGMSMEVEFYIPKNGPTGLEFNFSGDDDVWVFVDDELVLDLGGIHGALGGIVTFEEEGASGSIQSGTEIFYYDNGSKVVGGNGSLSVTGDFSPGTTHTLNFFYLERGGNASNCSIEFNIPPTTTDFTFIKA
ncbi:MAG: fibro-slime domain-containing protein, partial [Anaerovoracaceae bacterium]